MAGIYSVKNTLEVLDLGFGIGGALKAAKADGMISLSDLQHVMPVFFAVPPALEDLSMVPKEILELDADDQAQVLAHVKAKMPSITDDAQAILVAAACVKAGLAIGEVVALLAK